MTEVISVRFKNKGKSYFFDHNGITVEKGQSVIVETAKGLEFAECAQGNHMVEDENLVLPLRPVIRVATEADIAQAKENKIREAQALAICQEKIRKHGLDMKLVDVEYNFDSTKILFFFTSDGRVDFRDLVKDLASVFKTRIELRQIGVRDEARLLGGLGICGRPFCCAQFLDDFQPVSIKMAKTQGLSLNPTKISGTCGRLMCCLKYEQDAYEDLVKNAPKVDAFVDTPAGKGSVMDVNLLRSKARVRMEDTSDTAVKTFEFDDIEVLGGKSKRQEYLAEQAKLREEEAAQEKRNPKPFKSESKFDAKADLAQKQDGANKRKPQQKPYQKPQRDGQNPKFERKPKPNTEAGEIEVLEQKRENNYKPRPDNRKNYNNQGRGHNNYRGNKPERDGEAKFDEKPKTDNVEERTERKPRNNQKPYNNRYNQKPRQPRGENGGDAPKFDQKPRQPRGENGGEAPKYEQKPRQPRGENGGDAPKFEQKPRQPRGENGGDAPKFEQKPRQPRGENGGDAPKFEQKHQGKRTENVVRKKNQPRPEHKPNDGGEKNEKKFENKGGENKPNHVNKNRNGYNQHRKPYKPRPQNGDGAPKGEGAPKSGDK